jgi:hypothetical protein
MPKYLNEDQVDTDSNVVCYPHLLLCMGVTLLMDDGALIGGHYTRKSTEEKVSNKIIAAITKHGGRATRMYMTGNFYEHVQNHGGQDYTGKARLIGYTGEVVCFDTQSMKPKDGTFVRITSLGANADCLVEYKREERVVYTDTQGMRGSSLRKNPKKLPLVSTYNVQSVDTVSGTPLHIVKTWTVKAQV